MVTVVTPISKTMAQSEALEMTVFCMCHFDHCSAKAARAGERQGHYHSFTDRIVLPQSLCHNPTSRMIIHDQRQRLLCYRLGIP
jgi:hypothetical protein